MRPKVNPIHRAIDLIDRIVPAGRRVVVRTFPDYDDQCREVGAALAARGIPMTLLVDDTRPPQPPLDFPCTIVRSTSPKAAWAFWRAKVVVHTHGVYGMIPGSRSKRFLNLWHGMPVKRLVVDHVFGRTQSHVTLATSPLHAGHLATIWGLEPEQVRTIGLPRNDALFADAADDHLARSGLPRPLAVWLPTFRTRPHRPDEADGSDLGTVTQFRGADLDRVEKIAEASGFHILIKPHPAAARPEEERRGNVTVWSNDDLRRNGWTLYRLLANADVLITDVSSVWIDFLLLDRPIVFAMSDREEYLEGRGSFFEDLDELVPGRICADADDLEPELLAHRDGADPWRDQRQVSRTVHHATPPGRSADRVAEVVLELLDGRRTTSAPP